MSQIKGADTLEQCAKLAQNNNLPLHFHLIGYAYKDMAQLPADVFTIHGEFNEEELPQLIVESSPHLIWFPAHWPETYSYTLSSALLSGFPIVAPNIGAFPERVSGRPWTWICPWNWTSDEWNLFFVLVRNDNFLVNINPSVKNDAQSPTYYPYQDYIPSDRCAVLAESDLPAVRRILLKH